jgi:hypothetical protein
MKARSEDSEAQNVKQLGGGGEGVTGTPARILPTKYKQKDVANSAEDVLLLQAEMHRTQLLS